MPARHAVSAGHPLVAEAAARALAQGGSAVDACVSGALVACAVEPALAGLFGGGVLLTREPSGRVRALDFLADAPRVRRPERERALVELATVPAPFAPARPLRLGPAAIAAPGLAPGLAEAHARLGRLPFAELAAPAIEAARAAPLSAPQAAALARLAPAFGAAPGVRALFHAEPDRLAQAGEILRNPALADLLDAFAAEGARFMQEGEPAAMLAEFAAAGHLTRADIAAVAPAWSEPRQALRGGARISVPAGPSLGGTLAALALGLLPAGKGLEALARALAAASAPRLDALRAEASGAAPDPRPDPLPPLAPEALSAWAALAPASRAGSDGTAVAAADGAGMAAVLVLTNGAGCGDAVPGLGVVPNNLLGEVAPDLSAPGARDVELPETWVPGRRLAAALAPALVEWPDGTVAALGAAGGVGFPGAGAGGDGAGARAALACALAGLVDRREPLDIALAAPRIDAAAVADPAARHRPPPALRFEDDLPERARDALLAAFPEAEPVPAGLPAFGAVHAVRRAPSGAVEAAGDPRRDGRALTG